MAICSEISFYDRCSGDRGPGCCRRRYATLPLYRKIVAQRALFPQSPQDACALPHRLADFNSFVNNPVHFPLASRASAEMMRLSPFCTHPDALSHNDAM
jgi:hypothetical protein